MTAIMLKSAKVKLGTSEWREKRERLYGYFWKNIEPQLEAKLKPFLECNARPYAYMSVSELEQVDAFLKTVAGQTFWKRAGLEERYMGLCTMDVLRADPFARQNCMSRSKRSVTHFGFELGLIEHRQGGLIVVHRSVLI